MPVLVDTNVLLDVATEDSLWFDWSASRLSQAANREGLAINPIVYAELSVHYDTLEALEAALSGHPFARLALPWDAAFVAGKAYRRYRSRAPPLSRRTDRLRGQVRLFPGHVWTARMR